jgi:hypothetical protein
MTAALSSAKSLLPFRFRNRGGCEAQGLPRRLCQSPAIGLIGDADPTNGIVVLPRQLLATR